MSGLTFKLENNHLYVYGIKDFEMDKFACYSWSKHSDGAIKFYCKETYTLFGLLRIFEIVEIRL